MDMKFLLGGWIRGWMVAANSQRRLENQRAWVQGGLGTSTTLHARHLIGVAGNLLAGQQVTPLGPPASCSSSSS